ncbi:hypothetical protein vBAbaPP1_153 [Acinetobacter phage vB_AbaM_P1]|nr:hypothetical protein vBAbaPP1_153 [Acinetobacter phage vB_AbaM_P1]
MDFTNTQIVFIIGTSLTVFLLLVWHDKRKRKFLDSIEQTTYEFWMDYDNGTPEGDDSEDVYRDLRVKYLENYVWASRTFGVKTCLIKDDGVDGLLDDRVRFNYKATRYLFKYPSHLPTCFRIDDFKHTVREDSGVGYGTKGAELFMREFNEKIEELKNYRETNSLEIKYGFSNIYPEYALKNCVEGCTDYSKSGYLEFFHVKSEILPNLLEEQKWKEYVISFGWDRGDNKWGINRATFSG